MAKALECPACGAKHRLDDLEPASTFRCERCGQTLKVPAAVAASSGASAIAPPPRRRAPGIPPAREVIAVSATVSATDSDGRPPASAPSKRSPAASAPRRRVRWYWRFVAWLVAVPLGFMITAWPAYEFELIKKNDVLDVFVGSGTDRYTRLAVGTLIWALVTALLVQSFIEGGRSWAQRRRRRHDTAAFGSVGASG
ncbi:MAG: hypothetical protein WD271_04520 [Acidimicrobiia bacterium]